MTGTGIGNAFDLNAPKPLFAGTGKFVGGRSIPWANKAEAFAGVAVTDRSEIGQMVAIGDIVTGWSYYQFERSGTYPSGGEDSAGWNLVQYVGAGINSDVQAALDGKAENFDFAALVGTTWDIGIQPQREQTISADTDYTLAGGVSGKSTGTLLVKNTGAFVVTVDGDPMNVRSSGETAITVVKKSDGTYYKSSDYTPASTGPDTTPPTATFEATGANTIRLTANEPINGTGSGVTFDNGSPLTVDSVATVGATQRDYTILETMGASDTITAEITASDIEDLSGNSIEDTVTPIAVTNSIPSGEVDANYTGHISGSIVESPTGTYSMPNGSYMLDPRVMAGNGYVTAEVPSGGTASEVAVMGLDDSNALNNYVSNWKWAAFMIGGDYYILDLAVSGSPVNKSVAYVIGDDWRLERTGLNTIHLVVNGTPIHTFTTTSSAPLYHKAAGANASTSAVLKNPKLLGFA